MPFLAMIFVKLYGILSRMPVIRESISTLISGEGTDRLFNFFYPICQQNWWDTLAWLPMH